MDSRRFDSMTRALGATTTRRQALKLLAGAAAGGLLSLAGLGRRTGHHAARLPSIPEARAEAPANDHFWRTWARTDKPVADGLVSRTWMWGPEAFTGELDEAYAESPGGWRKVQYFDKSRMEITVPGADPTSEWYVTNGLLVMELVTGQMQVGNDTFEARAPAQVNVAGDADDPSGPTYATFNALRSKPPLPDGATVTQRVNRDGVVTDDPTLAAHGVTTAQRVTVPGIDHQVASPFWDFMRSTGTVYENAQMVNAALFSNEFYATGLPITEPYWANVKIANTYRDVLMQCFERRCLTYTPGNPPGWQVEAGNVGRHYHAWRYVPDPACPDGGTCVACELGGECGLECPVACPTQELYDRATLDPDYTHLASYLISEGYVSDADPTSFMLLEDGMPSRVLLSHNYRHNSQGAESANLLFYSAETGPRQAIAVLETSQVPHTSLFVSENGSVQQITIDSLEIASARSRQITEQATPICGADSSCIQTCNATSVLIGTAEVEAFCLAMLPLAPETAGISLGACIVAVGAAVLFGSGVMCDEFCKLTKCGINNDCAPGSHRCGSVCCPNNQACQGHGACCAAANSCGDAVGSSVWPWRCCDGDTTCISNRLSVDCCPPTRMCVSGNEYYCCPDGWACGGDGVTCVRVTELCPDPDYPHLCPDGRCVRNLSETSNWAGCCDDSDCPNPEQWSCRQPEGTCTLCTPGYVFPSGAHCCSNGWTVCPSGYYCNPNPNSPMACCHPSYSNLCN